MNLRVIREPTTHGATVGVLFVDDRHFGFTLEDPIREIEGQPVATWKIAGQTAIPAGRYNVALTHSLKFGRPLPLLYDVPGFSGVRIHPGNTPADTDGCLLVGKRRDGQAIRDSKVACDELIGLMGAALVTWVLIENPLGGA